MRVTVAGFLTLLLVLSLTPRQSPAGEIYDERIVPKFDGREWVAVHAEASPEEVIVEYALKDEDAEHWTELVTTGLYPVKPDSGVLEFVRDHYHQNMLEKCPSPYWQELFESDTLQLYSANFEFCFGPEKTEYSLVAFRKGIEGTHFFIYAAKDRKVFEKNLSKWEKLFQQADVFRPESDVDRLSSELLADTTRMIHITYRYQAADFEEDSFAGRPRHFWRSGTRYFRGEEPPDSAKKVHGLIITNEPDAWLINRMDSTGRHLVDPGPTFNTICPVFGELRRDGLSSLEFGKEITFFEHHGARQLADEMVDNVDCRVYELPRLYWILHLYVNKETGLPYRISRLGPDGSQLSIYYEKYQLNLPVEYELFKPLEGLQIQEG